MHFSAKLSILLLYKVERGKNKYKFEMVIDIPTVIDADAYVRIKLFRNSYTAKHVSSPRPITY